MLERITIIILMGNFQLRFCEALQGLSKCFVLLLYPRFGTVLYCTWEFYELEFTQNDNILFHCCIAPQERWWVENLPHLPVPDSVQKIISPVGFAMRTSSIRCKLCAAYTQYATSEPFHIIIWQTDQFFANSPSVKSLRANQELTLRCCFQEFQWTPHGWMIHLQAL